MSAPRPFFRVILILALSVVPLAANAQPAKVYRIGYLGIAPPRLVTHMWAAFRDGPQELGSVEGRNLVLEFRSAEGHPGRLPDLAKELVSLPVDVLVVQTTQAIQAARQATSTIPIVVTIVGDPVECGLAESLARPGGNLTGGAWVGLELVGKLLELLQEIRPRLSRLGMLWNPDN